MIQIIGLLLCIYLVFKGYEILQIGLCSSNNKGWPTVIGALFFVGSIVIAIFFAWWLIEAGSQVGNQMPTRLP